MKEFRPLHIDEYQVRVQESRYKGKATLLIYKDARADMYILDETVGPENWQKEFYEVKGNLYCRVGIKDQNTGEWIWKSDCGSESNIEKEKGEASDAFKRACFNWGIGRYLYTCPKIVINCPDNYYYNDKLCMEFYVDALLIDNGTVTEVVIKDKWNNQVFVWGYNYGIQVGAQAPKKETESEALDRTQGNVKALRDFCGSMKEKVDKNKLVEFYNYYESKMMNWKGKMDVEALWNKWEDWHKE